MRWLADEAYPEAEVVRVVLDNLNTHRPASLYQTFPAAEARRIAKRLEFHYTPKHGSWLNMAEIEFSVLARSCLKQRLPDEEALRQEVQALEQERNAAKATIHWRFNIQDARTKLHRLYPFDSKHDYQVTSSRAGRGCRQAYTRMVLTIGYRNQLVAQLGCPPLGGADRPLMILALVVLGASIHVPLTYRSME